MVGVRHTLDCKDCDCSLAVWRREAGRLSWCSPLWLWAAASSSAAVGSAAAASSAAAAASAALAAMIAVPAPSSLPSSASLDGRSPRVVRATALGMKTYTDGGINRDAKTKVLGVAGYGATVLRQMEE